MRLQIGRLSANVLSTLPLFIAVCLVAGFILQTGHTSYAMPLVLGIIAGGLVDLDNRLTGRLKNIGFTLAAFAISSLSIQLSFQHPFLLILVITLLAFGFTFIGALGLRYRTIAFGTLAVAIYTLLTLHISTIWYENPLLILTGALLYSLMAMLGHLLLPHRPVQDAMSQAYRQLAQYLDTKAHLFDPDEREQIEAHQITLAMQNGQLITAFNKVRTALFNRIRGQHRHPRTERMLHYYFAAQDIHERISSSHVQYAALTSHLAHSDLIFRIERLLEWQAQACRDTANALKHNRAEPPHSRLERAMKGVRQSLANHLANHPADHNQHGLIRLIDNLQSVNYQLIHLSDSEYQPQSHQQSIASEEISGFRNIIRTLKSHLSLESTVFRHSIRLSLLVFLSVSLISLLKLHLGYWILLTAVFVCQPNYTATKTRLKQRIIGTIAGVLVGSLMPYFTPTPATKLSVIIIASTLFFFFRTNKYSYSTFFITLQALTSFSLAGLNVTEALPLRLIDTLIGSALAYLAVTHLWPDWQYLSLPKTAQNALKSSASYLQHILKQLAQGAQDDLPYRLSRRRAHERAAQLSSTLSDMASEPQKYQAHLENGFTLLKTNYALISYISALGAYRSQINSQSPFLAQFLPIAEEASTLITKLPELSPPAFHQAHQTLNQHIQALKSPQQEREEQLLSQQLALISHLLPTLYAALSHTKP